jgi:hypothetical protein
MNVSRRKFVGSMGAGVAALGTLNAAGGQAAQAPNSASGPEHGHMVYLTDDWHMAEFDKLCKSKARVKQVYDCEAIKEGDLFNPMKNSINGLQFGFGIPADQIKVVGALRGPANLLNFDDSMWEKYKLGEYTKTNDPKTQQPATRNVFYPKKEGGTTDVQDRASVYQDYSIEALMGRGLQLLSCHNATENQARAIIKKFSLTVPLEEMVHDLQAHMLPGVISVPAMVAAIAMLQSEGRFAYTMG